MKAIKIIVASTLLFQFSCKSYFKDDYEDNSPTSGKLKVYYDEGLELHVKNQAATFESQYHSARIELVSSAEAQAVNALYNDSCKVIVISRPLSEKEEVMFKSKDLTPRFSSVAKSGIALVTNVNTPLDFLDKSHVVDLLTKPFVCKDSLSNETKLNVLFDRNNSSVMHYLKDSVIKGQNFSQNCTVLASTLDAIKFVANNKNTIAFIDFAWLSDSDDSLYKANKNKIKFIAVGKGNGSDQYELPGQDSFKRNAYPFTRTVYIYRRSGEFSLGKGFETFVAGPKGQITFLKQGLLPAKQQERTIEIKMEPINVH